MPKPSQTIPNDAHKSQTIPNRIILTLFPVPGLFYWTVNYQTIHTIPKQSQTTQSISKQPKLQWNYAHLATIA